MTLTGPDVVELTLYLHRDAQRHLVDYGYATADDGSGSGFAVDDDLGDWEDEGDEDGGEDADDDAYAVLRQHLGSGQPIETHVALDSPGRVSLLVGDLRARCVKHPSERLLEVQRIQRLSGPQADRLHDDWSTVTARWNVVSEVSTEWVGRAQATAMKDAVSGFFSSLWPAYQAGERARRRRRLYTHWQKVLEYQRDQLDDSPRVPYVRGIDEGNIIRFILPRPAPPRPASWVNDAPLAWVDDVDPDRLHRLGTLAGFNEHAMLINVEQRPAPAGQGNQGAFDNKPGQLCLDPFQASQNIDRQQKALTRLQRGRTANGHLADVLAAPGAIPSHAPVARFEPVQADLSADKRAAIGQALATENIFLLQGPPGTGKTTTLTEIVAQLLKSGDPLRILITSPSNTAVDNLLASLGEMVALENLEMVRIENKSGGAVHRDVQRFRVSERSQVWRKRVATKRTKSEKKAQGLRDRIGRVLSRGDLSVAVRSELQHHADLLTLLDDELDALVQHEYERAELCRLANSGAEASAWAGGASPAEDDINDAARQQYQERIAILDGQIAQEHETIASVLEDTRQALRQHSLAEIVASPVGDDLHEETDRLRWILLALLDPAEEQRLAAERKAWQGEWEVAYSKSSDVDKVVIARATIVAATCSMVGGSELRQEDYDWVLLDEAGQATVPQTLIPLVRARRCILVGDERQLPPRIDQSDLPADVPEDWRISHDDLKKQMETSLFEQLVKEAQKAHSPSLCALTEQHRMHHGIGSFVSSVFYDGAVTNAPQTYHPRQVLPRLDKPVLWISTSALAPRERYETRLGDSFYNTAEVEEINRFLQEMQHDLAARGNSQVWTVGVIAAYKPQVGKLVARLTPEDRGQARSRWTHLDFQVSTVDSFQGRQREIIVYSPVRSNSDRDIGFLRDTRRLNVALSRARVLLVIVGDLTHCENATKATDATDLRDFKRIATYLRNNPECCAIQEVQRKR